MLTFGDVLARLDVDGRYVVNADLPVRWVATSELADPTPYLEGGEILLLTGIDTARWRTQWNAYARRLAAADVVAVGFAVGLTHDRIPRPLLTAARKYGLNVFAVPPPMTFVSISRTVATMLERAERDDAAGQRDLVRAALRPDGAGEVVSRLAALVRGTAAVVDDDGRTVVGEDLGRATRETVRKLIGRLRGGGRRGAAVVADAEHRVTVHPLGVGSSATTYLVVAASPRWAEAQRASVSTGVALLSLDAALREQGRASERRLRAGAITVLLGGQPGAAREILELAEPPLTLAERVRIVVVDGRPDAIDHVLDTVERIRSVVAAMMGDQLVAVVPGDPRPLSRATRQAGAYAGIGPLVDAERAAESAEAARLALARTSEGQPVVDWVDCAREGIAGLLDATTARSFVAQVLDPVLQAPDADALVDLLECFLARHGHRVQVAAELGIHRNTVRRRLTRIEDLIGRSLDDPGTRADLWVALRLRD